MRFLIDRVSLCENEKPCDEAFSLKYIGYEQKEEIGWFVDITNLNQLFAFSEKYGAIVFEAHSFENLTIPSIKIYDSYIE